VRRRHRRPLAPGRGTLALGALATGVVLTVVVAEVRRAWRRGSTPALRDTDHPLLAAEGAVADAARVARAGYRDVSTRENSMFNLLTSFATTFLVVRTVTTRSASGGAWGRSGTSGSARATSTTTCPGS
jgi:hypothetical protein